MERVQWKSFIERTRLTGTRGNQRSFLVVGMIDANEIVVRCSLHKGNEYFRGLCIEVVNNLSSLSKISVE